MVRLVHEDPNQDGCFNCQPMVHHDIANASWHFGDDDVPCGQQGSVDWRDASLQDATGNNMTGASASAHTNCDEDVPSGQQHRE